MYDIILYRGVSVWKGCRGHHRKAYHLLLDIKQIVREAIRVMFDKCDVICEKEAFVNVMILMRKHMTLAVI